MPSEKQGFTLIETIIVVAITFVLLGFLTSSPVVWWSLGILGCIALIFIIVAVSVGDDSHEHKEKDKTHNPMKKMPEDFKEEPQQTIEEEKKSEQTIKKQLIRQSQKEKRKKTSSQTIMQRPSEEEKQRQKMFKDAREAETTYNTKWDNEET